MPLGRSSIAPNSSIRWPQRHAECKPLHRTDFPMPRFSLVLSSNFEVELEESSNGLPSNGKGKLVLPDSALGKRFMAWARRRGSPGVRVAADGRERRLYLRQLETRPGRNFARNLQMTPYQNPMDQQERERIIQEVKGIRILLDAIQFGVFFRQDGEPIKANRSFSNEYEIRPPDTFAGDLSFDYDGKTFRIEVRFDSYVTVKVSGNKVLLWCFVSVR